MADNQKKRKHTLGAAPATKRPRFPAKPQHNIRTTNTSTAYPNGEINVSRFMRTHENEIKALEKAMKSAKKGLSRRAFQDVPRDLRRRTGSHNPQRVPKRLRMKARKEAIEDNTPIRKDKSGSGIGKETKKWLRKEGIEKSQKAKEIREKKEANKVTVTAADATARKTVQMKPAAAGSSNPEDTKAKRKKQVRLAVPATPPSRFRRRQVHKTWLPTHIWHAKRALMSPPKEPLWRFAVPLSPVVKGYRLTHRASTLRGAVAWDMSYMSTIGLEGAEASIVGLLKGLHFAEEDHDKPWQERGLGKKWRDGTRVWEGWIYERGGKPPKAIAQVAVIWSVEEVPKSKKRKAFIRVHPSAFLQLWNEIIRIAKVQKPAVAVEDLRFEIGSIEITGPAAAETLCSILTHSPPVALSPDTPQSIWPTLAPITDTGVLPFNPILAFSCSDPRLHDPRLHDPPRAALISQDQPSQSKLTETLAYWPVDKALTAPAIFNRNARLAAGRCLSSQKSINRRKSAALPGQNPEARSTDPHIPMLTFVSNKSKCWTILLPWKCLPPFWRGITRYPISTGGNPRFGGLKEARQVSYERSRPYFPFDCPGTDAGWAWELHERAERKNEWTKRPKGKRIEWSTIDLGNGRKGELGDPWACDWERLTPKPNQEDPKRTKEPELTISPVRQMLSRDASDIMAGHPPDRDYLSAPHLFTVKISMLQRGVPTDCARVYRLPTNNAELRNRWLALMPGSKSTAATKQALGKRGNLNSNTKHLAKHLQTRALAASLLDDSQPKAGETDYPYVPDGEDLIGFVTTGNYNLAEGKPAAIANIALHKVIQSQDSSVDRPVIWKGNHVCIVREAGQTLGRLATWEAV